jgi:hypothetical protein
MGLPWVKSTISVSSPVEPLTTTSLVSVSGRLLKTAPPLSASTNSPSSRPSVILRPPMLEGASYESAACVAIAGVALPEAKDTRGRMDATASAISVRVIKTHTNSRVRCLGTFMFYYPSVVRRAVLAVIHHFNRFGCGVNRTLDSLASRIYIKSVKLTEIVNGAPCLKNASTEEMALA